MPIKYQLEIYRPNNSGYDSCCFMESDSPFLPIQKGDLINPRTWNSHYSNIYTEFPEFEYGIILRVTGFEHFIVQREDGFISSHKIGIFTEAISDIAESRP